MKRLILVFIGLFFASCDSGTKTTDGTSSETKTSLQALADNVRKVPATPSASSVGGFQNVAGRRHGIATCPEHHQTERYWPDNPWGEGTGYTWHVARNKIVACTSDSTVLAGHEEYRFAGDSTNWQVVSEITIHAAGNRTFRSSFESELGGGFTLHERLVHYQTASGGPDKIHLWQFLERVLTDGNIEVDLRASEPLNPPSPMDSIYDMDTIEYRSPIFDLTRGRMKIGNFFDLREGRVEVRDLEGHIISPRLGMRRVQPDSMGLRLIANTSDADSFRISLRLQTLEPPGFASAATALVLTDSSGVNQLFVDSLPQGARVFDLGKSGPVTVRRIDWAAPRVVGYDRVCLLRRYPKESGTWNWMVAAVLTLDGRVVEP